MGAVIVVDLIGPLLRHVQTFVGQKTLIGYTMLDPIFEVAEWLMSRESSEVCSRRGSGIDWVVFRVLVMGSDFG